MRKSFKVGIIACVSVLALATVAIAGTIRAKASDGDLEVGNIATAPKTEEGTVGSLIVLEASVYDEAYGPDNTYEYKIMKDDVVTQTLYGEDGENVAWYPTEAGLYKITFTVTDSIGRVASKTIDYMVKGNCTIYYRGYETPYIHYCVDGVWTEVPGRPMTRTDNKEGFEYMFSINLDEGEKLEACFNNGKGNYSCSYGNNFFFEQGEYEVRDSVVTKIN